MSLEMEHPLFPLTNFRLLKEQANVPLLRIL